MSLTVTDLFAGAGGSSTGMHEVPGVHVDAAGNHWDVACDIHNANHPTTDHYNVDLHEEDPAYFPKTDVLWASPECTKWSQAAGGRYDAVSMEATLLDEELMEDPAAEVAKRSRLLMFDVLRFIAHHRYRLVFIENVVDIAMRPKYRLAWDVWRRDLRNLGYRFRVLSINSMHAQAFGPPAPQSRDRLYIACWPKSEAAPDFERILRPQAYCPRCDAMIESQQAWKPGRTVGKYRDQYVYIHGSCGTAVEPGFLPALHAIDWSIPGQRIGDRLADKTRLRIAGGIAKFWGHPQHGDPNAYYRTWAVDDVIRTLHTIESKALAVPAGGTWNDTALPLSEPLRTQTTRETTGLLTPFVSELYGTAVGRPVTEPASTFTAGGNHHALVSPYYSGSDHAQPTDRPLGTLTTVDRYALVHRHNSGGAEMTTSVADYLRTLTTAGHQSLIHAPERIRREVTQADRDHAMGLVSCPPNARDLMAIGAEHLGGAVSQEASR